MNTVADNAEIAGCFAVVANRFCSVVDSASSIERTDLLLQIYRILPKLVDEAISLPDVRLSDGDDPAEGFTPAARAELAEAQDWYEGRHRGLGSQLLASLRASSL